MAKSKVKEYNPFGDLMVEVKEKERRRKRILAKLGRNEFKKKERRRW